MHPTRPPGREQGGSLVDRLGLPWTLVIGAVFRAIFEEIGFRGLLQGRLSVVYGRREGILLSGAGFGLAHGVTPGLPFHLGLGFYLGWLRERSGSLLPGMLTHLVYNAIVIWRLG